MQQQYFDTGVTRSLAWRKEQLDNLEKLLSNHVQDWQQALKSDLGKHDIEATLTEITGTLMECLEARASVSNWMTPTQAASPALLAPAWCEIRPEPRGVTLIIAPFNYPVSLALNPLISALAAGDTAVIKPSELCPAVADMLARLVPKYFREEVVSVVTGGIPETTALMQEAWDLVFFTGSERVGKIIAGAAAATLSPVVLELGGKSPVLVTESCPELTAMCDRIVWGKTVNCGQTCVAPDYMLCHESKLKAVTECLQQRLALQYGQDQHATSEFGRNVTAGHTQRLKDMLEEAEEAGCKVLTGGSKHADPTEKYFPTSIVCVDPAKHANLRVLKEEIFGGILPVMAYTDLDQAVRYINAQPGTPLALYVFTNDKAAFEQVANACPSGGLVRNDVLIHFATSSRAPRPSRRAINRRRWGSSAWDGARLACLRWLGFWCSARRSWLRWPRTSASRRRA